MKQRTWCWSKINNCCSWIAKKRIVPKRNNEGKESSNSNGYSSNDSTITNLKIDTQNLECNSIKISNVNLVQDNSKIQYNTMHRWKLGSLNIRSGKEKLEGARIYSIAKEIARENLTTVIPRYLNLAYLDISLSRHKSAVPSKTKSF